MTMPSDFIFDNTVEIIEKKSRFYGYLIKSASLEKIEQALDFLRKQHKKATHICWACRISAPFCERAVDDGEPNGTAGKPILSVLQKRDAKDVCVIVVRYFGGIKLGAGGLVRVYTKVTSEVLQ